MICQLLERRLLQTILETGLFSVLRAIGRRLQNPLFFGKIVCYNINNLTEIHPPRNF